MAGSLSIDVVKVKLNLKSTSKLGQGAVEVHGEVKGEGEGASWRGVQPNHPHTARRANKFMSQKGNQNSIDFSAPVPAQLRRASCCVCSMHAPVPSSLLSIMISNEKLLRDTRYASPLLFLNHINILVVEFDSLLLSFYSITSSSPFTFKCIAVHLLYLLYAVI